jgi:hypothetical protein
VDVLVHAGHLRLVGLYPEDVLLPPAGELAHPVELDAAGHPAVVQLGPACFHLLQQLPVTIILKLELLRHFPVHVLLVGQAFLQTVDTASQVAQLVLEGQDWPVFLIGLLDRLPELAERVEQPGPAGEQFEPFEGAVRA